MYRPLHVLLLPISTRPRYSKVNSNQWVAYTVVIGKETRPVIFKRLLTIAAVQIWSTVIDTFESRYQTVWWAHLAKYRGARETKFAL